MKAEPIWGILVLFSMAAPAQLALATSSAQSSQRGSDAVVKSGCPAAVPPATSNSAASATDYVELQRSRCEAGCEAYTVRVRGDGEVTWRGEANVASVGDASAAVGGTAAVALIQDVAERGFWGLCGRYERRLSGQATFTTTLSVAGHAKRVEDYAAAAPSWLRDMDLEIDSVSNSHQWRHGGPEVETFGDDRLAIDAVMPKLGVTELMKDATYADTSELVKTLKLLGPVNQGDSSGWTALMYAAQAGPPEAMSLLLAAGADPDARTNEGETPLFAAVTAASRSVDRLRLLTAAGVDLNAADHRGATPLMVACRHFTRPKLVETLLGLGADPSKRANRAGLPRPGAEDGE
jgi:hypothetical protein